MPPKYERIKESYLRRGKSLKVAKKLAAMTFNAQRKPGEKPVGPGYHRKRARKLRRHR